MRILLINPNVLKPPIAPVGLEYTAEQLIKKGYTVKLIDQIEQVDLKEEVIAFNPQLIGLQIRNFDNTMFFNQQFYLDDIREQIAELKGISEAKIMVGGTAVNLMPEEVINYVGADIAIATKGFRAMEHLLSKLEKGEEVPKIIADLDDYVQGSFKRNLINHSIYEKKGTMIGVATKFGCPFECTYCDYPAVDGKRTKLREPSEVVDEIRNLVKKGTMNIFFVDANFNVPAWHAIKILKILNEEQLRINWDAYLNPHPRMFTDEFFQELFKSGKKYVNLGVDSLDDATLRYLQKMFTVGDVKRATELCHKNGIKVNYNLLFGSPMEKRGNILGSFRNIDMLKPDRVDVCIGLRVYKKTPLYYQLLKEGKITEKTDILKPYYVPIPEENIALIQEEAAKRPNCFSQSIEQFMIQ
ncbi:radical SAM protein [Candidatus Woesearchaeota archaeon]|nr:radical SAM protein [Candidatus Woesearchaeota archaeon]